MSSSFVAMAAFASNKNIPMDGARHGYRLDCLDEIGIDQANHDLRYDQIHRDTLDALPASKEPCSASDMVILRDIVNTAIIDTGSSTGIPLSKVQPKDGPIENSDRFSCLNCRRSKPTTWCFRRETSTKKPTRISIV